MDRSDLATLYIDGSSDATVDVSAAVSTDLSTAATFYLGGGGEYDFAGTMGEVAFWNDRLLTSGEVAGLYAAAGF